MLYFFRLMIPAVAFGLLLLSGVACNKKRDEVRQIAVEQPDSESLASSSKVVAPTESNANRTI